MEVAIQQARGDVEPVIAVRFAHQRSNPPVPHTDTELLQFIGHPRGTVNAQSQTLLLLDQGQNDHVHTLPAV